MANKKTGLALLREPFESHQISKLPKPTKQQTEAIRADFKVGIRCQLCGAWHHKDVVHLDYVGHAALTDRLLDCDDLWNWEPFSIDQDGQPIIKNNTMWIKLTVCGVTRLGFGDAGDKTGPNAIKEIIGDALRNAAMRFGAALDLWHKGDLHIEQEEIAIIKAAPTIFDLIAECKTVDDLKLVCGNATKEESLTEQFSKAKSYKYRELTQKQVA
jgi:hypothetical protein